MQHRLLCIVVWFHSHSEFPVTYVCMKTTLVFESKQYKIIVAYIFGPIRTIASVASRRGHRGFVVATTKDGSADVMNEFALVCGPSVVEEDIAFYLCRYRFVDEVIARDWAKLRGLNVVAFRPNWLKLKKALQLLDNRSC